LGEIGNTIGQYMKNKMVHEFEHGDGAKEQMVNDWHESILEEKTAIMLAYTRDDVRLLNERAREVRKSYRELGEEAKFETVNGDRNFATGERIYFLQNNKELGVKNGTLGTIKTLNSCNFEVKLDKGNRITFDIKDYHHIDHGYAATIHKSQGITVDKSFVLASKYMDRHSTYVAMSRHRESTELYWSKDKFYNYEAMVKSLGRENRKELAMDYVGMNYRQHIELFSGNKGVDATSWIDDLLKFDRDRSDLMQFDLNSSVHEMVHLVKDEFKSGICNTDVKPFEELEYLGNILIDGKDHTLLGDGNIRQKLLKDAVINRDIAEGDRVQIIPYNDGYRLEKGTADSSAIREYNREKALREISNICRKLESKEN
jgi:hypothetical protein